MPENPLRILVVDDEPAVREVLAVRIQGWGYEVRAAADMRETERQLGEFMPDVVISDVVLGETSGLDLLKRLKAGDPRRPVILITAHGSIDVAVEAMKGGAEDFLTKPLDYTKLHAILASMAVELRQREWVRELESRLKRAGVAGLVGESRAMRQVFDLVATLAASDASAIISGESGTGKEVVARAIHELSARRAGPFVAVNAAAIPEGVSESELFGHEKGAFTGAVQARPGYFELADGGTLFLDEITEMPMALQPKLLRILETRRTRRLGGSKEIPFDVRVLAATNRQPLAAVRSGQLREDLFYRLNVFEITLPPLRERLQDVPLLAHHFMREFNRKHDMAVEGLREATRELLCSYAWPGNVRELRNVIERAVILAREGWLEPAHLPPYIRAAGAGSNPVVVVPVGTTVEEAERELILRTLEHVGHNKAEAARRLGIDVKTIRNKLRTYGET